MLYNLQIERQPWWEDSSPLTSYTNPAINALGGKWIPGSLTYGTLPSRIGSMYVVPATGMGTDMSTIWLGILPKYSTSLNYSNYNAKVEAESGTRLNGSTLVTGDAFDSGDSVQTPTLTSVFAEYLQVNFYQHAGANANLYRGRYQLLARLKVASGKTAGVRVKWGCVDATGKTVFPNQTVYVSATSWTMFELGEVVFPSFGGQYADDLDDDGLIIEAKHISGSAGSLYIDCFVLIPCRHMVKVSNGHVVDSTDDWYVNIKAEPNDVDFLAANYKNSYFKSKAVAQFSRWEIPIAGAIFIVCTQLNIGTAPLNEQIVLNMDYYPRWMNYRE
jgi:hypothetical protein